MGDAVRSHLQYLRETWSKPFEVAIATAYFNPEGFGLLADELERVESVRLLLGAQPEPREQKVRALGESSPLRAEQQAVRQALTEHIEGIVDDRDLLGFTFEADRNAKRLLEWLGSGNVEVRRYEKGFLHGKAFLVATDDEGVLSGSSNFTYGGLATNLELNLGHYQPHVVVQVRNWLDGLWEEANPFDLAAIYADRYLPHSPFLIYLRMLFERYGSELEAEALAETGGRIRLATFQRDGVWRAKRILEQRNGVLIADGVGLGKTFIAGALMREAIEDRRQRVLLIAPATLRDGTWARFLAREMLHVETLSFDELAVDRALNPDGTVDHLQFDPNDYAMVFIDEAHALRNPDTQRATALRRLLQGHPPKPVVLLTATPVNNSLWDLFYLLSYFIHNDAAFADAGIGSLRDHFREAMATDPEDLSPARLFDVLDAVAVRRSRHFVKRYYPLDTIRVGNVDILITFPKPHVIKVPYSLDETYPGFFDRFAHAIDCSGGNCPHSGEIAAGPTLSLARYMPSTHLRGGGPAPFELQLAGLLRTGLLKRFESSAHAFAVTCGRMAESHRAFLGLLEEGYIATSDALNEWISTDAESIEDLDTAARASLESAAAYDVDTLRTEVTRDLALLEAWAAEAKRVEVTQDPKIEALVAHLAQIAEEAEAEALSEGDARNKRKVAIFSYFADTIDWLSDHLPAIIEEDPRLAAFRGRLVHLTGSGGSVEEVLFGFAPVSMEAPAHRSEDRFDLLLTTDVLAEGVNLQQARHIINYDLPWNPMRLVQRHGRIDRIGSPHDHVYLRCFFPDEQLDALLGLEQRLLRKISQAAASVGVEGEVLPGSRIEDVTFAHTREEVERLRQQDATLFETGGEVTAFSGEEYRQELRQALEDSELGGQVRGLAWGAGSGMARSGAARGYVFCARVGDHPLAQFRYVGYEDGSAAVVSDTLACLAHVSCGPDSVRVLDEATHLGAYDSWAAARKDIFDTWQRSTDPRNLQPTVPRTMREAAEVLRASPPAGLTQEELSRLIDAVEGPYPERIQRIVRAAARSSEDPVEQAVAVAKAATDLGLQPAPAPVPLPVIAEDDVHLVCWMAIVPTDAPA